MSYFFEADNRTRKALLPGVESRTWWGERMLMSLVDLAPHAVIPSHSHPHEQIGTVIRGEIDMTVAGETHHCKVGSVFVVPGGVEHNVNVGPAGAQTVEMFAPVREEYKFPD